MNRINQLDSLRGLAAITVLINHYLNVLPQIKMNTVFMEDYQILNLIKYTPVHIFWAGYAAVILFFVLSGYVLSLPFYKKDNKFSYVSFMIKRFFRLYIPYIISVGVAVIAGITFSKGGIETLSAWFNSVWKLPFNLDTLVGHILFIGNFDYGAYNPIYWSLVYEMRISIILPFIIMIMVRSKWYTNIVLAFVFLFLGAVFYENKYLVTLFYVFMFIVGALLAKHRFEIQEFINNKIGSGLKTVILLIGIVFYTYEHWIPYLYSSVNLTLEYRYHWILVGVFTTIGCSIFIILATASRTLCELLLKKPVRFLGKISYSIYLYHCIALFTLTYLLFDHISLFIIWLLSLALTLILATIGYYLIEKPSIRFAKLIINKIYSKNKKVKVDSLKQVSN